MPVVSKRIVLQSCLLTFLIVCIAISSKILAGPKGKPNTDKVVAIVLGKKILAKDITPTEAEKKRQEERNKKWPSDQIHLDRLDRSYRIMRFIFPPIIKDYVRTSKIQVTEAELDEFTKAMQKTIASSPMASDPRMKDAFKRNPQTDMIAKDTIQTWKVGRSLYRKYGGIVIFQQANPVEPVGAYLKFLEQRERDGAIKFLDPKVAEDFWYYFKMDHGHWKQDSADPFDKPWWSKMPTYP